MPGHGLAVDHEVDGEVEALRRECRERAIEILPGDRVSMRDAARLLGRAYGTLKNWRYRESDTLRGENMLGRVTFALVEIARARDRS